MKKFFSFLTAFAILFACPCLSVNAEQIIITEPYVSEQPVKEQPVKEQPIATEESISSPKIPVDVNNFEYLLQMPKYPAGCELMSSTMALHYINYNVSAYYLNKNFLKKDNKFYYKNGKRYGPNPCEVFAGDPETKMYGCFPNVIVNMINDYLNSEHAPYKAVNISNSDASKLYQYVDNNTPVIVWATMNLSPIKYKDSWYLKGTNNRYSWPGKEHCLVLVGYNKSQVILADPLKGKTTYDRALFESRYNQMQKNAVVIIKK